MESRDGTWGLRTSEPMVAAHAVALLLGRGIVEVWPRISHGNFVPIGTNAEAKWVAEQVRAKGHLAELEVVEEPDGIVALGVKE